MVNDLKKIRENTILLQIFLAWYPKKLLFKIHHYFEFLTFGALFAVAGYKQAARHIGLQSHASWIEVITYFGFVCLQSGTFERKYYNSFRKQN